MPPVHEIVITDLYAMSVVVHLATERYTRARARDHDGYAEATTAYSSIGEAVQHLASRVNLVPEGRLML